MRLKEELVNIGIGVCLAIALLSSIGVEYYSNKESDNYRNQQSQLLNLIKEYGRTIAIQNEYLEMQNYLDSYNQVPEFWNMRVKDTPQNFTIRTRRGLYEWLYEGGVNYSVEDRLIWGNKTNREFFDYLLNNVRYNMQNQFDKINYLEKNQINYLIYNKDLEMRISLLRIINLFFLASAVVGYSYILINIRKRIEKRND